MRDNKPVVDALLALSNEVENDLLEIKRLNDLAKWIERARAFIEAAQLAAERDDAFKKRLSQIRQGAWLDPSWEEEDAEGLGALHRYIGHMVSGASKALAEAVDAAQVDHG